MNTSLGLLLTLLLALALTFLALILLKRISILRREKYIVQEWVGLATFRLIQRNDFSEHVKIEAIAVLNHAFRFGAISDNRALFEAVSLVAIHWGALKQAGSAEERLVAYERVDEQLEALDHPSNGMEVLNFTGWMRAKMKPYRVA